MGKVKIAVNGMGRIGRTLVRAVFDSKCNDLEVVAINNPGVKERYVHLLKYDSLHGKFNSNVNFDGENLEIEGKTIRFFSEYEPEKIDWSSVDADIVIDATGKFKDGPALSKHLSGSVKKVIMCAPGKELDGTFVYGINHKDYDPNTQHIVSNASCTTNCLAPVAKVLNECFGIENGLMTTIHAYTSDQNILDGAHSDMRRARAAALNMVPTTTGAAKAVGLVIPELSGKLDGFAIRVPTPDVSLVDLTVNLKKDTDAQTINQAMKEYADGELKGVLAYTDEELVSVDFMGRTESSIFDSKLTNVIGKTAKVLSWYDNEVGFSYRVLDLANYIGQRL